MLILDILYCVPYCSKINTTCAHAFFCLVSYDGGHWGLYKPSPKEMWNGALPNYFIIHLWNSVGSYFVGIFLSSNLSLCVCLLQLAIFPDSLERRLTALKELVWTCCCVGGQHCNDGMKRSKEWILLHSGHTAHSKLVLSNFLKIICHISNYWTQIKILPYEKPKQNWKLIHNRGDIFSKLQPWLSLSTGDKQVLFFPSAHHVTDLNTH